MYENHNIPVNEDTLIYGFNPDISFAKTDKNHEHPLTDKEAAHLRKEGQECTKEILPTPTNLAKSPHVFYTKNWLKDFTKSN